MVSVAVAIHARNDFGKLATRLFARSSQKIRSIARDRLNRKPENDRSTRHDDRDSALGYAMLRRHADEVDRARAHDVRGGSMRVSHPNQSDSDSYRAVARDELSSVYANVPIQEAFAISLSADRTDIRGSKKAGCAKSWLV